MTGYVRQDSSDNIATGNTIDAAPLDAEFDAIQEAFNASTGHTHDGETGEGAPILVIGPAQDFVADTNALAPKTDSTYTLGTASLAWSDIFTDSINLGGTAITATAVQLNDLGDFAGIFTLPSTDGTNGQVLATNGSGTLSFQDNPDTTYTAGTGLDLTSTTFSLDTATLTSLDLADTALQSGDNVSALTNDSNYATEDEVETATLNAQTGTSYTLALSDRGQIVTMDNASANTVTVPTNASVAFDTGSVITVIRKGAGVTTITGDTGVTVNGVSAGSLDISPQYQAASLLKVATDTWIVSGAI